MKNKKNQKTLKLKKTKVLKFYQMETLLGGLVNTTCTEDTAALPAPAAPSPRRPIG